MESEQQTLMIHYDNHVIYDWLFVIDIVDVNKVGFFIVGKTKHLSYINQTTKESFSYVKLEIKKFTENIIVDKDDHIFQLGNRLSTSTQYNLCNFCYIHI